MNTLSKVAVALALICSLVAYAKWEGEQTATVGGTQKFFNGDSFPSPVSVATSADGKTVYYAHSMHLYKSTDGGESWTVLK